MFSCDNLSLSPIGQHHALAPASLRAMTAGLPALAPTNTFIGTHPGKEHSPRVCRVALIQVNRIVADFVRDASHFDHSPAPTAFAPCENSAATSHGPVNSHSARPGHYSASPTMPPPATATASVHLGHQSPWVAQPTGSFATAHFQGSPPSYPLPEAHSPFRPDYFAVDGSACSRYSPGRSDISGSPTLGERTPPTTQAALPPKVLSNLSAEQQRIVKDADPAHQQDIIQILASPEFSERGDIPAEKLQTFYNSVPHERCEGDKQGSRGGAAGYTCHWHACSQADRMIKRRDHMLNHIRGHFGVKPFGCRYGNGHNLPRWCVSTPPLH
jgi:hypothetical protein